MHDIFAIQKHYIAFDGDITNLNISKNAKEKDLMRIYKIIGSLDQCDIDAFPNLCTVSKNITAPKNIMSVAGLTNLVSVGGFFDFSKCVHIISIEGIGTVSIIATFYYFFVHFFHPCRQIIIKIIHDMFNHWFYVIIV